MLNMQDKLMNSEFSTFQHVESYLRGKSYESSKIQILKPLNIDLSNNLFKNI